MNIGYNLKRPLHKVFNKHFITSRWFCRTCLMHVPSDHGAKYPTHIIHSLGVRLTKPKPEQFKFRKRYTTIDISKLPRKVDWRPILKDAGIKHNNQNGQGCCTAETAVIDKAFQEVLRGTYPGKFSVPFVYYQERVRHGCENEDSGAYMEDEGIVLGEDGVCLDSTMPFNPYDYRTPPSDAAKAEAKQWTTDRDQTRLSWGAELMAALNEGPVMVYVPEYGNVPDGMPRTGIAIYSSFWNSEYNGGYVSIPQANESLEGGHSLLAVGYDQDMIGPDGTRGYFIFWGSWGELICAYGDHYIPIEYHKYVGDSSDIWQQFDQVPGPGPQPTDCLAQENKCMVEADKEPDILTRFVKYLFCVWDGIICVLGQGAAMKMVNSSISKGKKSRTLTKTHAKTGLQISVTIRKVNQ